MASRDRVHRVLTGLLRERQEIAAEIEMLETRMHPWYWTGTRWTPRSVGEPPRSTCRPCNTRIVLDFLQAERPQTPRGLIDAVMATQNISRADRKLYLVMRSR